MMNLLLDHLWQSTLFALAVGLLTLLFRNNGAHVRYGLWFTASVKFLVPFSALVSLGGTVSKLFSSTLPPPLLLENLHSAAQPFSQSDLIIGPAAASMDWPALLLGMWAVGFVAVATVWFSRWRKLRAIVRDSTDAAIAAPMPVKFSRARLEPGLVGIVHPVLLLPEGVAARLSPAEMKTVLAHELCHLRRRDNLTAAIHMLVAAVFWFHPLLWWLGARLVTERERACDEAVLACGNDPRTYAQAILKVCDFCVQSPLACAAGVSGSNLKKRMEMIMTIQIEMRLDAARKILLGAAAFTTLVLPLLVGLFNATPAFAQAPAPMPDGTPQNLAQAEVLSARARAVPGTDTKYFTPAERTRMKREIKVALDRAGPEIAQALSQAKIGETVALALKQVQPQIDAAVADAMTQVGPTVVSALSQAKIGETVAAALRKARPQIDAAMAQARANAAADDRVDRGQDLPAPAVK